MPEGQEYYSDLKRRLPDNGCRTEDIIVMPGVFPVLGSTRAEAEAEDKFAQLQDLIHPEVAITQLSPLLGIDLTDHDPDGPVPDVPLSNGHVARQALLVARAWRDNLSILELALSMAGARGHWQVVGTPSEIADALQERFEGGAADGFNIMAPVLPTGLEEFVDRVVPELQRRGLYAPPTPAARCATTSGWPVRGRKRASAMPSPRRPMSPTAPAPSPGFRQHEGERVQLHPDDAGPAERMPGWTPRSDLAGTGFPHFSDVRFGEAALQRPSRSDGRCSRS